MTYKNKLIELLKGDVQIKEAMEKLEFGTHIILKNNENDFWSNKEMIFIGEWDRADKYFLASTNFYNGKADLYPYSFENLFSENNEGDLIYENLEIIGLPLQERFIRMYCESKDIRFSIHTNYYMLDDIPNFSLIFIEGNEYCKIDNSKDFDNQEDKVYQKIYEALIKLK